MNARRSKMKNPDSWWSKAYLGIPHIIPTYEFEFEGKEYTPSDKKKLKFKNTRGEFYFRCIANNVVTGASWFDVVNADTGEWRSFRIEKFKCVVMPRRRRVRRAVAQRA